MEFASINHCHRTKRTWRGPTDERDGTIRGTKPSTAGGKASVAVNAIILRTPMVYCVVMHSMTSIVDDGGSDWMANGICFFGTTAGGFVEDRSDSKQK